MRALLLAGVALAAGVQNPALSLQTPAGVSLGNSQPKSHESSRKFRYSRKSASGRALNLAAPYRETEIITEGLQDVPMSASRFAKEESRVTNEVSAAPVAIVPAVGAPLPDVPAFTVPSAAVEPITVEPITVGSSEPMSASRFADEESKIANEEPEVDPAAALPTKRLRAKQQQEAPVPKIITAGAAPMQETIVDSQDSMSASRFADQQSKTGMPQHIQAPVAVAPVAQQQQVDPAAALPIKRLKEKSVKWDTDILPTLPKAEWLGDRPTNTSCVSIDVGTADSWCQTMCATTTDNPLVLASTCPEKTCRCDAESKAVAKQEHDEVIDNWHEAEARVRTADVDTAYPDGLPHFEDAKPTPDLPTKAKRDHLSSDPNTCRAIHIQATDHWCATQCATEECPLTLCKCDDLEAPEETAQEKSTDEWAGTPYDKTVNSGGAHSSRPQVPIQSGRVKSLQPSTCRAVRDDATDEYCVILCATQDCPLDLCKCADTPTMDEVKEAARREAAEAEKKGLESIVPTLPQAETEVPGRDGPIDISEGGAAKEVPLLDTGSPSVPTGIKEIAAQCFSTVDSGNPGGQYANDLWCKTTCANHNCPKAQCECGPDMEYITEEDVWQKDKKPTWASKRDEKNAKKEEERHAEREEKREEKHAQWKMKQHGPKWNAKHDPDMEAIRSAKQKHGRKGGDEADEEDSSSEEQETDGSDYDKADGSHYDNTISLRRSAKHSQSSRKAPWSAQKAALAQHAQQHAKHLKHAQHAKHQAHVKHGAHAQRALDRMQSDYAQREQARDEKRAISAREADSTIVVEPPAVA